MKQKINENRLMAADNISQLCTWVDYAYVVHPNMKSHTGGGMSFGYGIVH